MKPGFILVLTVTALLIHCSCTSCDRRDTQPRNSGEGSLNSFLTKLNSIPSGNTDSLLSLTLPVFYAPPGAVDTLTRLCSGIYTAQEYVYTEKMDSACKYISYLKTMERHIEGTPFAGMFYTAEAFYELKANRDFSKGISLLIKSYNEFENYNDIENMVMTLTNIVQIFYSNSDVNGFEYAEKACSLSSTIPDNALLGCMAAMSMAQMLSLSGNIPEAIPYVNKSDTLSSLHGFNNIRYMIYLLRAYATCGETADSLYRQSLMWAENAGGEPSSIQQVLLKYGGYKEAEGHFDEAMELYRKGLEISRQTGCKTFTDKILLSLSNCAMKTSDTRNSIDYYKKYLAFTDSLSTIRHNRELSAMAVQYRLMEHKLEVQEKNIELITANRKIMVIAFSLTISLILTISIAIVSIRQRKMYRELVCRYKNHIQLNEQKSPDNRASDYTDYNLWLKVESLMRNSRIYRQKDITLDILAKEAGTNRTYLSKTINKFSGGDFYSYLNRYRIKEAVDLIESSENRHLPFKSVADMVGYNSVQVFHNVFIKETGLPPGKYREEARRLKQKQNNSPADIFNKG